MTKKTDLEYQLFQDFFLKDGKEDLSIINLEKLFLEINREKLFNSITLLYAIKLKEEFINIEKEIINSNSENNVNKWNFWAKSIQKFKNNKNKIVEIIENNFTIKKIRPLNFLMGNEIDFHLLINDKIWENLKKINPNIFKDENIYCILSNKKRYSIVNFSLLKRIWIKRFIYIILSKNHNSFL